MNPNQKQQRQQLIARLKSSIATAAIVGTLGGWAAFGMNANATAVDTAATTAVVQVADASTLAQSAATSAQSSTQSTTQSQRSVVTTTRSSR